MILPGQDWPIHEVVTNDNGDTIQLIRVNKLGQGVLFEFDDNGSFHRYVFHPTDSTEIGWNKWSNQWRYTESKFINGRYLWVADLGLTCTGDLITDSSLYWTAIHRPNTDKLEIEANYGLADSVAIHVISPVVMPDTVGMTRMTSNRNRFTLTIGYNSIDTVKALIYIMRNDSISTAVFTHYFQYPKISSLVQKQMTLVRLS